MPALSITAPHLAMSAFMRAVIASGVLARIAMPICAALRCSKQTGLSEAKSGDGDTGTRLNPGVSPSTRATGYFSFSEACITSMVALSGANLSTATTHMTLSEIR